MVLTESMDIARLPVGNQDRAVLIDVGHGPVSNPLMGREAEGTVRGLHEWQPLSIASVWEAKEHPTMVAVAPYWGLSLRAVHPTIGQRHGESSSEEL